MNATVAIMFTIPWDPSIGFVPQMVSASSNAFVVEEKGEKVILPHLFDVKDNSIYVVSSSGYTPTMGLDMNLLVYDLVDKSYAIRNLLMRDMAGKDLHHLRVLSDSSYLLLLYDEESPGYSVVKYDCDGSFTWKRTISDVNRYQGERVELFEDGDDIVVVVYRERELIFDIVEKENGSVFRTWQEKRLADRLFQAEKGTLVGMNYDVEKNEHRLWKYNLISRHSSYVALNREYYGWFHNVLGVDNVRHELILTSGKDLARYSLSDMTLNPFGFYGQLDSPEKENIPDVSVWKIDVKGEVYIPIATEAGLSFINVTL